MLPLATVTKTATFLTSEPTDEQFLKIRDAYNKFKAMRKQFLGNFSTQFPNELNCSSIRINAQQQDNAPANRKADKTGSQLNSGPKLKKYEQHDIVGFQMSLSIDDNRENFLELMRSKSAKDMKFSSKQQKQKLQHSKREKQHTAYGNSLYNTNSFDEMTMNITANTKNNNATNIHNNTDSLEYQKNARKTLKIPPKIHKQSNSEDKYIININRQQPNIKIQDQQQKKVPNKLLESLKLSVTEQQKYERSIQQVSYEEPYFKIGSTSHLQSSGKPSPQANKLFTQDHNNRRDLKKVTSVDHIKSVDKKLTLRDYMYLSQLSGCKDRERGSTEQPPSPQFTRSPNSSRSRKKLVSSNAQVMERLKRQVMKNIELVQGNLNILAEYIGTNQTSDEVSKQELMGMYNIARIVKDRIVSGNDELVMMLQEINREK